MLRNNFILLSANEIKYNFYYSNDGRLCYRSFNNNDNQSSCSAEKIVVDEKIMESYVTIDENNNVHLLCLSENGDLKYYNNADRIWKDKLLCKLEPDLSVIKSLFIKAIDNKVYVFYALSNSRSFNLWSIHFKYWNGIEWKSSTIGMTACDRENNIYCITTDSQNNLHLIYKNSNTKGTQLFYRKYHFNFSLWSSPEKIITSTGQFTGFNMLCDSEDKLHLTWSESTRDRFQIMYKKINPKVLNHKYVSKTVALYETKSICSHPVIFESGDEKWCMWTNDNNLLYCQVMSGGPIPGRINVISGSDASFLLTEYINFRGINNLAIKGSTFYAVSDNKYFYIMLPEKKQVFNYTVEDFSRLTYGNIHYDKQNSSTDKTNAPGITNTADKISANKDVTAKDSYEDIKETNIESSVVILFESIKLMLEEIKTQNYRIIDLAQEILEQSTIKPEKQIAQRKGLLNTMRRMIGN